MKCIPQEIVEMPNEGLMSFMNKPIVCYCSNYIYKGVLIGVNTTCIKLKDVFIVYDTRYISHVPWNSARGVRGPHYIQLSMLESFGSGV